MNKQTIQQRRIPTRKRVRSLLALANDLDLHTSLLELMNTPEAWDSAMADPNAWMRANGLKLPRGMQAMMTKDISFSTPLPPEQIGMPGPDWFPYNIKFTNCRTFIIAVRDEDGKIVGYNEETVCFGLEILLTLPPGPLG